MGKGGRVGRGMQAGIPCKPQPDSRRQVKVCIMLEASKQVQHIHARSIPPRAVHRVPVRAHPWSSGLRPGPAAGAQPSDAHLFDGPATTVKDAKQLQNWDDGHATWGRPVLLAVHRVPGRPLDPPPPWATSHLGTDPPGNRVVPADIVMGPRPPPQAGSCGTSSPPGALIGGQSGKNLVIDWVIASLAGRPNVPTENLANAPPLGVASSDSVPDRIRWFPRAFDGSSGEIAGEG